MALIERIDPDSDIAAAAQGIRNRLDTLASISVEHILIPADHKNSITSSSRRPMLPSA